MSPILRTLPEEERRALLRRFHAATKLIRETETTPEERVSLLAAVVWPRSAELCAMAEDEAA